MKRNHEETLCRNLFLWNFWSNLWKLFSKSNRSGLYHIICVLYSYESTFFFNISTSMFTWFVFCLCHIIRCSDCESDNYYFDISLSRQMRYRNMCSRTVRLYIFYFCASLRLLVFLICIILFQIKLFFNVIFLFNKYLEVYEMLTRTIY